MATLELIRELHERRHNLISQQREVFTAIEASPDGDGTAEKREEWDRLDKAQDELRVRIEGLQKMHENEQDQAKQRGRS
jgi:hypothetical protein